jgi:fucose 4-O-acetylase-like acetyltransferase
MQERKLGILRCLVQIGIPLFFYISGSAVAFHRGGFLSYLKKRTLRLIIPLIIAIPVFLIPRLYFGQEYEDFALIDGKIESNFF